MARKFTGRLLGSILSAYVVFVLVGTLPAAAFTSMSDDFSSDSGNWQFVGDAKRTGGYVELAPARAGAAGIAWLKQDVRYPFVAEFRAQVSSLGEGMVFMFHHDKGFTPGSGGKLGAAPATGSVNGWGVELDILNSGGDDTGAPHLGLVGGDPTGFHYKNDPSVKFNDGNWHSFKVEIEWSTIILTFDGKEVWHFSDYSYKNTPGSRMGFSAASAGGAFRVDDFKLMKPGEEQTLYWITFGIVVGTIFFGTLGGIAAWGSLRRRAVLKQYAQPGVDYGAFKVDSNLRKQVLAAAKNSPDPEIRKLRSGYGKCFVGQGVASFLMMASIIGTLFMPAILVLTLGVVLMIVFISLFAVAATLAGRRSRPFIVLMGQRMGIIPPGQYGGQPMPGAFPGQAPTGAMAASAQQTPWQAPPPQTQASWQTPPPLPPAPGQVSWGEPPVPPAPGPGMQYQRQPGQQYLPSQQFPPGQFAPAQQPPGFQPPGPAGYQPPPYPGAGTQPYRPAQPPARQAPAQTQYPQRPNR